MQPEARLRARCHLYLKAALQWPATYSAIEHGRVHAGTPEQRAREWGRLKSQGVKVGLFDMIVLAPDLFIGLELKAGKNTMSDAQEGFAEAVRACRHHAYEVRSVAQLHDTLAGLGLDVAPSMRILAMSYDACLATPEPTKKRRAPAKVSAPKPKASTLAKMHTARRETFF